MDFNFLGQFDTKGLVFPGILAFHYLAQPLQQSHAFRGHEWIFRPEDDFYHLQTGEAGVFLYYDPQDQEIMLMSGWPNRDHRITVWQNGEAEYQDKNCIFRENDREEIVQVTIGIRKDYNSVMVVWQQNLYEGGSVANAIAVLLKRNTTFTQVLPYLEEYPTMRESYVQLQREQLQRIPSNVLREYDISSSGEEPFSQEIAERLKADYLPNGAPSVRTPLNMVGMRYLLKEGKERELGAVWRTRQGLGELPSRAAEHLIGFFDGVPRAALRSSGGKFAGFKYELEGRQDYEMEQSWVMLQHYRDIASKSFPVFEQLVGWYKKTLEQYPEEDELWIEPA